MTVTELCRRCEKQIYDTNEWYKTGHCDQCIRRLRNPQVSYDEYRDLELEAETPVPDMEPVPDWNEQADTNSYFY